MAIFFISTSQNFMTFAKTLLLKYFKFYKSYENKISKKNRSITLIIKRNSLSWQGLQESNPQQWFWRPLLYHLTKPLNLRTLQSTCNFTD